MSLLINLTIMEDGVCFYSTTLQLWKMVYVSAHQPYNYGKSCMSLFTNLTIMEDGVCLCSSTLQLWETVSILICQILHLEQQFYWFININVYFWLVVGAEQKFGMEIIQH